MFAFFGIGLQELLILTILGAMPVVLPLVIVILVVVLSRANRREP